MDDEEAGCCNLNCQKPLSNVSDNELTETDNESDPTRPRHRSSTIALFTARAFLPGLFKRKVFLIVGLLLPLLDFATDCMNAGAVLLNK